VIQEHPTKPAVRLVFSDDERGCSCLAAYLAKRDMPATVTKLPGTGEWYHVVVAKRHAVTAEIAAEAFRYGRLEALDAHNGRPRFIEAELKGAHSDTIRCPAPELYG
jgi:hypothetical protein